jgi:hypothetical protein
VKAYTNLLQGSKVAKHVADHTKSQHRRPQYDNVVAHVHLFNPFTAKYFVFVIKNVNEVFFKTFACGTVRSSKNNHGSSHFAHVNVMCLDEKY